MTNTESHEGLEASRRTRLANERTYLAWWRTGFAALAISLAIGALLPVLSNLSHWPLLILGSAFALFGVWLIVYGHRRYVAIERALGRGEYLPLTSRETSALVVVGILLGAATVGLFVYVARH